MKFLHQTGDTIPLQFNDMLAKLILTSKDVYYYESGILKIYDRDQVIITYDDHNFIRSFNTGNSLAKHFVRGDDEILLYLKERLSEDQYFEFERFLFERT